jgi:dGTPase
VSGYAYTATDFARRADEPAKRAGGAAAEGERSPFARDRARVLHAYAFRRLADKTQVRVPGEDDFPRTRLTHSLEVAQIGRELGVALGCDPDIVDTAGLAHDIGHPPFGHNGEAALDAVAQSCGGFEGNAQTLRVLTQLEAKVLWPDGSSRAGQPAGLNLTRATLDAVCKYPWGRTEGQARGTAKFGVYTEDAEDAAAFAWMREAATDGARCIEAQVMDWADDVAYSVHDVEDGVHAGLIRLGSVGDEARQAICEIAAAQYSPKSATELAPVLDSLLGLPTIGDLAGYDGSYAAQAAAKRATSELTGRFAAAAVDSTRATYGREPLGRYAAALVIPEDVSAECALLKAMAVHYVMRRPAALALQAEQRRLLTDLVEVLFAKGPDVLEPALVPAWRAAGDDDARLRVAIDQVAQLTDTTAASWHARLCTPLGG